jgi:hypothetical protein
LKRSILFCFLLANAGVAYAQTRMPPPNTSNSSGWNNSSSSGSNYGPSNNGSNSGWDNSQTRSPLTGSDPADRVGTFQIMLQGPPIVANTLQQPNYLGTAGRGFGIGESLGTGGTFGYVGLSGAVGYTLSSLFELGGGLSFGLTGDTPEGGTAYNFMAEPFIKLNLGPAFKTGALNPFVLAGLGIGVIGVSGTSEDGFNTGGSSSGIFDIDINPGVEWLVGGRWGFDFYIPIDFAVPLTSGSIGLNIGVGYGLVAYL